MGNSALEEVSSVATALTRTEHYVSREDGKVYYYKVGEGEPVIFLHNIELSSYIWAKVIDQFADHFTCYALDLPGHDHSDIPAQQYWVEDFTRSVIDVMDSAGIAQASIVGSHGGSMISLDLAATHPERVKRLVADGLPYWNQRQGLTLWEKHFSTLFTDTSPDGVPVKPLPSWEEAVQANPRLDREHWEKELEIRRRSRRWITLSLEALTKYDAESTGPRTKAPVLLMYGENDPLRRGEIRAMDGIKGSVHKLVPQSSGPHWDQPDEFARMAIEFLQGA